MRAMTPADQATTLADVLVELRRLREIVERPQPMTTDLAGVAALLGLGLRTVARLHSAGELPPCVRVCDKPLWLVDDLRQWLRDKQASRPRRRGRLQ